MNNLNHSITKSFIDYSAYLFAKYRIKPEDMQLFNDLGREVCRLEFDDETATEWFDTPESVEI